jgi:hypothetical protein
MALTRPGLAKLGPRLLWVVALFFTLKVARSAYLNAQGPSLIDFYYFWDAAGLVLEGRAGEVYLPHESQAGSMRALVHPPPFLMFIAPLAVLPFGVALASWLLVTGALYTLASRQPLRLALAYPAAAYNGLFGQTGFLTAAFMLGAANLAGRRPVLAGALAGCMVVKPHLALLLPLALAAGRLWVALASAAVTACALLATAWSLFGSRTYALFFDSICGAALQVGTGGWDWALLASPFAFLRWFGLGSTAALVVHAAIASAAAVLAWRAWRQDTKAKVAVLAAASLLVSPYIFAYDAVLLIVPIGYLAASRRPGWAFSVAALAFLPLAQTSLLRSTWLPAMALDIPNMTPVAAILSLAMMEWLGRQRRVAG